MMCLDVFPDYHSDLLPLHLTSGPEKSLVLHQLLHLHIKERENVLCVLQLVSGMSVHSYFYITDVS